MRQELRLPLVIAFALTALFACPFFGLSTITPSAALDFGSPDAEIFWRLRVPRTLGAFVAGAGLAVGGMVFQAMFRNALATPYTLGVSGGAALGAAVYVKFGTAMTLLGALGNLSFALAGGALSMVLVYGITRAKGGFSTSVMLLAGVIVNFFFSGLVMFIQYLSNANESMRMVRWMMGSLTAIEPVRLVDMTLAVLLGALFLRSIAFELDLLSAGEEIAAGRGVAVERTKTTAFLATGVIVAAIVSIAGPIGFVGMMVPHACRFWFGWSHEKLLPAVFMAGGGFLVLCDLAARTVLAPAELPVGIVTSMLGGPFFLWTLWRSNRRGELL